MIKIFILTLFCPVVKKLIDIAINDLFAVTGGFEPPILYLTINHVWGWWGQRAYTLHHGASPLL